MTAKPTGPIPPEFAAPGVLRLGGKTVSELIAGHHGPLFVYDMGVVAARVARFRASMPKAVALHYAIKANPLPALLERITPLVDGLDVASLGEMERALRVMPASRISFAGPGKDHCELSEAANAGVLVNAESRDELLRLDDVALNEGVFPRVALRINPEIELRGSGMRMGGRASPFGIDEAEVMNALPVALMSTLRWEGLHVYAGSQSLDAEAISAVQRHAVDLAARIARDGGHPPLLVNLGGGFGVPYFAGDKPLNVEAVGNALAEAITAHPRDLAATNFAIELGRWLVAEAGVYLTRVIDRKVSHGETFLVVDGGLHHQLAASGNFGTVVRRNYPIALAHRIGAEPDEVVTVVGRLCTPLDRLGDRIALPRAEVGDVIAIFLAGAYGATASPTGFLGHPPAGEIVVG